MKLQQRTVRIVHNAPAVSREELARELAFCITKGDPVGYLARVTEKYQREMESKQQTDKRNS